MLHAILGIHCLTNFFKTIFPGKPGCSSTFRMLLPQGPALLQDQGSVEYSWVYVQEGEDGCLACTRLVEVQRLWIISRKVDSQRCCRGPRVHPLRASDASRCRNRIASCAPQPYLETPVSKQTPLSLLAGFSASTSYARCPHKKSRDPISPGETRNRNNCG